MSSRLSFVALIMIGLLTTLLTLTLFAHEGEDVTIHLPYIQNPAILSANQVIITKIFFDGVEFQLEGDEYVEIRNEGSTSVQLHNWTLRDWNDIHVYTFPNYLMQPNDICRIYTDEVHWQWCGFNFAKDYGAIWNNDGDTATLRDSDGVIIDVCAYAAGGDTAVCQKAN